MKGNGMSIGDLARQAGVASSTVRYYERCYLLSPDGRTESNYRVYGPESVERLRFIRAAQTAGLTLADIRILLHHRDGLAAPCREVRNLLEQRLASIETTLRELRHARGSLRGYLEICRESAADAPCRVVNRLRSASSRPPTLTGSRGRPERR